MDTTVDLLVRFESGSPGDALTLAILNAATRGSGYTWAFVDADSGVKTIQSAAEATVNGLQIAGGSGLGDSSGTRGVSSDCSGTAGSRIRMSFASQDLVSVGAAIMWTGFPGNTSNFFDSFSIEGPTGEFSALNTRDAAYPSSIVRAHTKAGGSATTIPYHLDTRYWATMLWDRANMIVRVRLYDMTSRPYVQVGSESTLALSEDCAVTSFTLGRSDNVPQGFTGGKIYTDDVAISFAGTWPLLPSDGMVPAAPTGLAVNVVSSSALALSWVDNSDDETGYRVERSLDGSTGWTQVADIAAGSTSYNDTGLSGSTAYYYRVFAYNDYGDSESTAVENATTSAPPGPGSGVCISITRRGR